MKFTELPIAEAWRIDSDRHADERGFFSRLWAKAELAERGLAFEPAETSLSFNAHERTLRGLHYQEAPNEEVKLVTCVSGRVWDVILDLRRISATFKRWHAQELDALHPASIYVPAGCAHGFMTLTADATLLYEISSPYAEASARGVRWDDPDFGVEWPAPPQVMSERDRAFRDFSA